MTTTHRQRKKAERGKGESERGRGEEEEEDDPAPARSEEREQVSVRVGALLRAETVLALRDGAQDARQRLDRRRRVPLVVAHVARVVRQRDDRRLRTSQETSSQSQRSLQKAEKDERTTRTHPDLLARERLPIDALEPGVVLDVLRAALEVAEPLGEVVGEEAPDEVLGERVDVPRHAVPPGEDLLVDLERVVGEEGRVPGEELEQEDAERPPVGGGAVARCGDLRRGEREEGSATVEGSGRGRGGRGTHDLGREVLGRAAQRPGALGHVLGLRARRLVSELCR